MERARANSATDQRAAAGPDVPEQGHLRAARNDHAADAATDRRRGYVCPATDHADVRLARERLTGGGDSRSRSLRVLGATRDLQSDGAGIHRQTLSPVRARWS